MILVGGEKKRSNEDRMIENRVSGTNPLEVGASSRGKVLTLKETF